MCGIVVSRSPEADHSRVRRRGPDLSRTLEVEGLHMTHHLLSITGEVTPQPFVDGDVVCLYNGEIYNHPFEVSDGEVLIPLYRRHGVDFAAHLEGEFAIALYDFAAGHAVFVTDPISTKPLWRRGVEVASYPSALGEGAERVAPNTRIVVDLATGAEDEAVLRPFDFAHQEVETYDRWIAAFEHAVEVRAKDHSFLSLSAGYDSGAIDCILKRSGISYKTYAIEGRENLEVLGQRGPDVVLTMTEERRAKMRAYVEQHTEPYTYRVTYGGEWAEEALFDDPAVCGLAWICDLAKAEGRRVCYSGQGADEILCDYSEWPWATELNGRFPDVLSKWRNFDSDRQRAYLTKEEHVAGTYGIETRYPFLDFNVIQEFLWLTPEAKNRRYKAPLHEFLTRHDYPFEAGHKQGFSILPDAVLD
ncbi:MAG: asparagine synthase-related protein [Acidobacteriota bacterium]